MGLRYLLPASINKLLFGDRNLYGLICKHEDPDWIEWERISLRAYTETQQQSLGRLVNHSGYKILKKIDLRDKAVFEVGPGSLEHSYLWSNAPKHYTLWDCRTSMLEISAHKLLKIGVNTIEKIQVNKTFTNIPVPDNSFDLVFSFYSLEHLYPLENYLKEFKRILKKGGLLVGAIPTEGGIAWGLGRMLTTNRWFKKHTDINLGKIICWEHPNFADEILEKVSQNLDIISLSYWPFCIKLIDLNLIISFIAQKK